ncbi:MAG: hypothetical protein ACI4HL_03260 [Ruminococcus sp.]
MKNNIVKRIASLFLLLIIVLGTGVLSVSAEEQTQYTIDELKLSLKLPSSMDVVTRNVSTNDEVYKKHQTNIENLVDYNIYLQAFFQDNSQVFTLTMNQDDNSKEVKNYNTLSEEQLNEIKENYIKEENCKSCSMDKYNDIIYFDSIINTQKDDETIYVTQADTLVNGMYVHFTLQSQDGEIDQADKELMNSILESAVFELEGDSKLNDTIMTFIWVVVIVIVVVIVALIIFMLIKKRRKENMLRAMDSELYVGDREERRAVQETRKNRNTSTGADRPDAFFDGVDGLESSESIDKIERELIREAHRNAEEYSTKEIYDNTEEYGKEHTNYREFLGEKEKRNSGKNKNRRKSSKNDSYNDRGNSSRKF